MKLDAATLEPIWVTSVTGTGGIGGTYTLIYFEDLATTSNGDLVLVGLVNSGTSERSTMDLQQAREEKWG